MSIRTVLPFALLLLLAACSEQKEGPKAEMPAAGALPVSQPMDTTAVDSATNYVRFLLDGKEVGANARIAQLQMDSARMINITTMMGQDIRSVNLFLNGEGPGTYPLVARENAASGKAYGYYFPDYNDPMNGWPLEGTLVITQLDLQQGLIAGSFQATATGEGRKAELREGRIVRGRIGSGFQPMQKK